MSNKVTLESKQKLPGKVQKSYVYPNFAATKSSKICCAAETADGFSQIFLWARRLLMASLCFSVAVAAIHDVICDIAIATQHAIAASPATENLIATIKQMAALDSCIDNANQQLNTVDELLDTLDNDCTDVENG